MVPLLLTASSAPTDRTLYVALVVAVIGPFLLAWLTGRQRRQEKQQEWVRQDLVAKRLEDRQIDIDKGLKEVAKQAKKNAESTDSQLHEIHTLVNSDMTAARQGELIAVEAHLAALARNVASLGPASEAERKVMEGLEERADELRRILADRLAQQKKAEADLAAE
jgi:hypothetical protein